MQVGCGDGYRYLDVGATAAREDDAVIARVKRVVTVGVGEVKALGGHGEGYRRGGAGPEAHALEFNEALEWHRMLLAGFGADGVANLVEDLEHLITSALSRVGDRAREAECGRIAARGRALVGESRVAES